MWKLESVRPVLETTFLDGEKQEAKARAALDGLLALGGQPTAVFLSKIANDTDASFKLRSLAVIGRTRQNPKVGAQLALPVLKSGPDGKDPFGIFDAFLANKQGPAELATVLKRKDLLKSELQIQWPR